MASAWLMCDTHCEFNTPTRHTPLPLLLLLVVVVVVVVVMTMRRG